MRGVGFSVAHPPALSGQSASQDLVTESSSELQLQQEAVVSRVSGRQGREGMIGERVLGFLGTANVG